MGPISNIGPKTPRAARDRPEQKLEAKFSRRNDAGDSPDGGRTVASVANLACGVWPHAAAPCAALPRSIVRQPWRTSGRPPRNIVAQPCAKRRTAMAQQLRNAAGSSPGHRVETAPSLRPMCAASAQRGPRSETNSLRSACTRRLMDFITNGVSSSSWPKQIPAKQGGGGARRPSRARTWPGPTGPGPTGEHSVHPYHRDFIITPIANQIGPIDSVSKTEYYDLKNHFSEPQCKMTVLPLNRSRTPQNPPQVLNTLSSVSVRESQIQYLCDPQWFRDTASRGPTIIVAPESQFRTCPSDHGKSLGSRTPQNPLRILNTLSSVSVRESRIQYLCDPQWFREKASRGPTTIVAPESQFRTCPTDHVKSI
ncbi:hypothetical protein F511_20797 [Dorcoceras hygrometricum]|uniref:Uncharacterized protein n=1 Tax=Dorcoceras hygrometricum TaxID=472368 RepID=A0A2Z7BDY6_9LAMI|nr:hypothetical protein F511_20797 [Dorcoceras hygrometricum]